MLASRISRIERRGIVLVLVLAMLGLLALIGITFATFSSQARINARNYAQSVLEPQGDALLDFALSQLITDTPDVRSALRGHSLARDMYGNDGSVNGYMTASPSTGNPFYITSITPSTQLGSTGQTLYQLTTNILSNDSTFYGFNFTRWILRVAYTGATDPTSTAPFTPLQPVNQTFEILSDITNTPTGNRTFLVDLIDHTTTLGNPTNATTTQLPAYYLFNSSTPTNLGTVFPFILDGRWLHAFNGTGVAAAGGNSAWGNFKFNGSNPNLTSMDEDYDACDLENWFLAIQSADGQVVIPSFHRPSIIRYDPTGATPVNDWKNVNPLNIPTPTPAGFVDSASRILRPRTYDGHDATTFPDLVPNLTTGKITYDVDNDGDGVTDSVWLDLGYPARRDSRGQLYKPLFSFMVIGLNGRIPLNTAGNLAGIVPGTQYPTPPPPIQTFGGGPTIAQHQGNTVSEIDPTYALQNANQGPPNNPLGTSGVDYDPFNTSGLVFNNALGTIPQTYNTQVDNATIPGSGGVVLPIDVRLTQLRNLLAGTRPASSSNGEGNFVYGNWPGTALDAQATLALPNGIADGVDTVFTTDSAGLPCVLRANAPVAGRWGEAQSVPGGVYAPNVSSPPAFGGYLNLVHTNYQNSVRAGYSYDMVDVLSGVARDAADDDFNMFDPWPIGHTGEVGDADMYDAAGALVLPVDRYRRFVTPADIDGTGRINSWTTVAESLSGSTTGTMYKASRGADPFGRVLFSSYFRPPGAPGVINTIYSAPTAGSEGLTYSAAHGGTLGAILYPPNAEFYNGGPLPPSSAPYTPTPGNYLPDMTNNPLHGFESFKIPNLYTPTTPPVWSPASTGGMVVDQPGGSPPPAATAAGIPSTYPTYDTNIHDDGLNHADELNLYNPNPILDSPFKAGDLEWLYRQQDVDGASLSSRLAQLAPVSFTNTIDGQRRRRLFALDSWETNNFVWASDNPGGNPANTIPGFFANNSSFNNVNNLATSANFANLSASLNLNISTPAVAQRDKKINLNFPLPVSNDPHEPVRQKWINDSYQLLKRVLPPRAVDTPEELAELGQFVVNIVDYRDPDCTITIWTNPDVVMSAGLTSVSTPPAPTSATAAPPVLYFSNAKTIPATNTTYPFVHFGMEYNPVAINEVLAYSFASTGTGTTTNNRFFVELVNTLTQTAVNKYSILSGAATPVPDASTLDLGGLNSAVATAADPYSGACWDLVFTGDDPASRPDPYRGDLFGSGAPPPATTPPGTTVAPNLYGLIPLNMNSFSSAVDASLVPLGSTGIPASSTATTPPTNFFYVIGNPQANLGYEFNPPSPTANPPTLIQTLTTSFDPLAGTNPTITWYPGILPGIPTTSPAQPKNYSAKITSAPAYQTAQYYWVCLRRPANLFAPVSSVNPMVVVDSMRFLYIEGTGKTSAGPPPTTGVPYNNIYSTQRMQPYRGGHAVPVVPNTTGLTPAPPDTRYGYTEQIAVPTTRSTDYGYYYINGTTKTPATSAIYHTLGLANDSSEPWDYLPFNDRDFSSVAELMMVPGCPPGLFTKQFAEFAPGSNLFSTAASGTYTGTTLFSVTKPQPIQPTAGGTLALPTVSTTTANASPTFLAITATTSYIVPHTFPYLQDKFFYTGASLNAASPVPTSVLPQPPLTDNAGVSVSTAASDGWFKMLEFFEVPNQMIGSIGPAALGTNFDWARQDMKPGLLNPNLIVDEEVFFSVLGKQSATNGILGETLLNFMQIPALPGPITLPLNGGYPTIPSGMTSIPLPTPVPLVVSAIDANGSPSYVYPISNATGSGVTATDPVLLAINSVAPTTPPQSSVDSRLKAAFVQFLWLRHGGSGYIFGNGSGAVGQNNTIPPVDPGPGYPGTTNNLPVGIPAERPFHSLSYPDIDYTVMRPNTLPPSAFTNPVVNINASVLTTPTFYAGDPGVRNSFLYPGYATGGIPTGSTANPVVYPSAIPVRRLFQVPDKTSAATTSPFAPFASNAGDSGDPFINNQIPANAGTPAIAIPIPVTGALPTYTFTGGGTTYNFAFNNQVTTINTSGATPVTTYSLYPGLAAGGSVTTTPVLGTPPTVPVVDLGGGATYTGGATPNISTDNREHPFFRMEMLERVMNLTTPRTHQYAVWITIGFFEVKRPGDLGMLGAGNPVLAFDILGPEVGAVTGQKVRYRGFYLVDRLQLTAFNSNTPGSYRPAVVYRNRIQ